MLWKRSGKYFINARDQTRLRAKVHRELKRFRLEMTDAGAAHFKVDPNIGVAKVVARLHGIADKEQCLAVVWTPAFDKLLQQR